MEKRVLGNKGRTALGAGSTVGAAVPGSTRAGLEGIQRIDGGERRGLEDYKAEHSENGIEERGDPEGDKELEKLLDLGEHLDVETVREEYWRRDATGEVIWKPPRRDQWIEENLSIRTKAGRRRPFKLNPVQEEYSRAVQREYAQGRGKQNIVLKARQVGMTSYIAARFFVQTISQKGTLTMLVAHDRAAAEEIFRIVHRFWNNLPEPLQQGPLKTSHSSARELVFPQLDSEFTVTSADENAGRGRTIQNLHCTEVARWGREGEEALASLRAAVVPGGEIVLESTANGAWGTFFAEWEQAEETGYTTHFFPWWFEASYTCATGQGFEMTAEEAELAKAHGLTPEQIAWRRHQWSALRGLAAQEFAEDAVECFRASGECVFEVEAVEQALREVVAPVETQENDRLMIWLPPRADRSYVIGVDPAGGGARGDYSCAQVVDRKFGVQCAELRGHYPPMELAHKLVELGARYNTALLAVERNNHGHGVLAHLQILKYPNMFGDHSGDGWDTNRHSRPPMIENMVAMFGKKPDMFCSERLLGECRTFVRDADGVPRGAPGTHDDCVLAMGIALAVRGAEAGKGGHQPSAIR